MVLILATHQILGVCIQILDIFCWKKVHSKSRQHKCAEALKVNHCSSCLTPVLFKGCDDMQRQFFFPYLILNSILLYCRKAYRGCMCTISTWASEHYTSTEHSSYVTYPLSTCHVLVLSLESWVVSRQIDIGTEGQGVANHPQMSWDKVFWLDGGRCPAKAPLLNGCRDVTLF